MPSSQNDPIILNNSRLDNLLTSIKDADRDAVLDYAPRLSGAVRAAIVGDLLEAEASFLVGARLSVASRCS